MIMIFFCGFDVSILQEIISRAMFVYDGFPWYFCLKTSIIRRENVILRKHIILRKYVILRKNASQRKTVILRKNANLRINVILRKKC